MGSQIKEYFYIHFNKTMQSYILIRHCRSSLLSLAKVIRKKSRGKVQEILQNQRPNRAGGKEGPPLPPPLFGTPPKRRCKSGFRVLLLGYLQQELGLWTCIHWRCRACYTQWPPLALTLSLCSLLWPNLAFFLVQSGSSWLSLAHSGSLCSSTSHSDNLFGSLSPRLACYVVAA